MTPGSPSFEKILLDQAEELLLLVDPVSLNILAANRRAAGLLGYEGEELIGRSILDLESALADVFYWNDAQAGQLTELTRADGLY